MRSRRSLTLAAFAAATLAAPAQAAWYAGVAAGQGSASETGSFGVPVPGFGPTVDHDLCGGTAVITVGAEPTVTSMDGNSTNYRVYIGTRGENWGFEFASFNVARIEGAADSAPYAVAQPTCNPVPTDPITVDAFGRKLEQIAFNGISLTPTYSLAFAPDWTFDMRATVAFWDREEDSQWQVVVTENSGGTPIQTYPTAASNGSGGGSGVDFGIGLGVGWELRDGFRLRLQYDLQPYAEFEVSSLTLGVAIDFGD
jgi:hypothetical protein